MDDNQEGRLTRRAFVKAGGIALFSLGVGGSPLFLGRTALGAAEVAPFGKKKTLVTIFQRGAMDGLMAVPPLDDPYLSKLRPRLGMSASRGAESQVGDLGVGFGLHPSFAPLRESWDEGRLAIVHGVGSPDTTRSHFDAQDYMETGTPGVKGTPDGWLNRAVGLLGHEATPFQAVSMGGGLPRSLYGERSALAINNLADFGLGVGLGNLGAMSGSSFESLYAETSQDLMRETGESTFEALEALDALRHEPYQPVEGADYPNSPLGNALKQIAQLIKGGVGLEVAVAETGGWDTHVQQGTTNGTFAQRGGDLAQSIAAFWADMAGRRDEVVVLTMTEFGRTVAENGTGGTDHGRGSCLFLLGNGVDGGQVHGTVPTLHKDNLEDGRDLPVTTDFREVFSEVANRHLGIEDSQTLFPEWRGDPLRLWRA
ncbi:DUF1501 domain-containing protein [bacterium]|nr:DUF1501 domain-containing protein [bacterium]